MTSPDLQQAAASAAVQRASRILLARQDDQGWWSGRCAGDVTLDAESLLAREVLGIRTATLTSAAAQQIRSLQQPDGGWRGTTEAGDGPDGRGDLSASVLAYLSLRLAGDSADAYHMAVAAGWIRDAGGLAAAGLVTRSWLATLGMTGWESVRVPAPEVVFLPQRYAAGWPSAAWGRPAVITLAILATLRPVRRLPIDLAELRTGDGEVGPAAGGRPRLPGASHTASLRRCGQWLVDWQQRSGLPAARRPVWPLALVALHLLGYSVRHPVLTSGLTWLDSATAQPRPPASAARSPAGQPRPLAQARPSVQDTALAIEALADAGLAADHPALAAAGSWLLLQRIEGPAGALGAVSGPAPAGWSFGTDGYPRAADTAAVLLALSRVELPGLTGRPGIRASIRWLTGTQDRDGSWAGSAAITAQVLQALATHGVPDARAVRRAVVFLLRVHRPDGCWPGPADAGAEVRVTAAVLSALLVAGVRPGKPALESAVGWLLGRQNLDAGWADSPAHGGRSDADGTARVLTALLAAGDPEAANAIDLAADWLVQAQLADGGWPDPSHRSGRPARRSAKRRGLVVPGVLRPLSALGRYAAGAGLTGEPDGGFGAEPAGPGPADASPVSPAGQPAG